MQITIVPSPPRFAMLCFSAEAARHLGTEGKMIRYSWREDHIELARSRARNVEAGRIAKLYWAGGASRDREKFLRALINVPEGRIILGRPATIRVEAELIAEATLLVPAPIDWLGDPGDEVRMRAAPFQPPAFDYAPFNEDPGDGFVRFLP